MMPLMVRLCLILAWAGTLCACSVTHGAARASEFTGGRMRIAFGSCAKEDKAQPIWAAINGVQPDLFVLLGDNIYADTTDPEVMADKYAKLAAKPGFQALRRQTRVVAIWDDHDYGQNDAGRENPIKEQARDLFLNFYAEPAASPRRTRADGIYTSYYLGERGRRVQLILPDLRWNRTALKTVSAELYAARDTQNMGPYLADDSSGAVMLGEAQWQWLEAELQKPADVRILASSLQVLPEFTGWEAWANFPRERQRLFDLINRHEIDNLFIISGDTHWSEFSEVRTGLTAPLFEATSSGLTEQWQQISPNRHRISKALAEPNFGVLDIDWQQHSVRVTILIYDEQGDVLLSTERQLPKVH